MASDYDASEFIDGDFLTRKTPDSAAPPGASANRRAPTREDVDTQVTEAQQKLAELKRAQEQLERERASLEDTRRRQAEFHTGREEMLHNLTRGLGLLEEAEFTARREAEQMAKTITELRDAAGKIGAIQEETWTKDNFGVELTRALTTLENARMEWNTARLKFPVLAGPAPEPAAAPPATIGGLVPTLGPHSFAELCRVGFALTWPLALVGLAALGLLVALLLRH